MAQPVSWVGFLAQENVGTFFIEATGSGERFANRY
jgi:hypothetical protein